MSGNINYILHPIHKMSKTHFYKKWSVINYRCKNKNSNNYKWYGLKGIIVEWKNFKEFKKDMYNSYLKHVDKYGEKTPQ